MTSSHTLNMSEGGQCMLDENFDLGEVRRPSNEADKRLRREIANSNERRRMQSINTGFQSLKALLPRQSGEKMSKASILQQTSEYLTALESEKTRLMTQNEQLRRLLAENENANIQQSSPPPKRKKRDTGSMSESSDEGIAMGVSDMEEPSNEELRNELIEARNQLERERRLRCEAEERLVDMETRLYPERLRRIATHVQAEIQAQEANDNKVSVKQESEPDALRATNVANLPGSPQQSPMVSSMAQRNLETIVQAIRHLEGDHGFADFEENQKDSEMSVSDESEAEEVKSGQMSVAVHSLPSAPVAMHHSPSMPVAVVQNGSIPSNLPPQHLQGQNVMQSSSKPVLTSHSNINFKYPIASNLLAPSSSMVVSSTRPILGHRPAVIVPNLS